MYVRGVNSKRPVTMTDRAYVDMTPATAEWKDAQLRDGLICLGKGCDNDPCDICPITYF